MVATAFCLLFVGYLFWNDIRKRGDTKISWIPLIWMFLAGSRWVSSWLSLSVPLASADAYAEGSPIDRAVFFGLILAGVWVLSRRNIEWPRLLAHNGWIVLYLAFCLSSMLWADDPFVLSKRWIKDLGNPIMALIMLTEQNPIEAVGITLRRLAFLLLPLSVLFVRYYPELGRSYHADGSPMFTGVGHQKNDLGLMCLSTGIYFAWKVLQRRRGVVWAERPDINDYLLIVMLVWLLRMSDSQTSFACLLVTVALLLVGRLPIVSQKNSRVVTVMVLGAISYVALDSTFQIKNQFLAFLGRDPGLTNRSTLWDVVRMHEVNPIVGAGFMSFWSGERMQAIWRVLGAGINQAHNGYLEQYLNLGYIGVAFITVIMVSGLLKVRRELDRNPSAGLLRLCLITTAVLYNYTEASFYGMSNMWVLLLVACLDVPVPSAGQPRIPAERRIVPPGSLRPAGVAEWQSAHRSRIVAPLTVGSPTATGSATGKPR
jgi:exopolysaccharide production protein ExoQ